MGTRIQLQTLLETTLGSRNVYYQPPSTIKMSYPAIVYERDGIKNTDADDAVYKQDCAYNVVLISRQPDIQAVFDLSKLPKCSFSSYYVSDNLNHYAYKLYY